MAKMAKLDIKIGVNSDGVKSGMGRVIANIAEAQAQLKKRTASSQMLGGLGMGMMGVGAAGLGAMGAIATIGAKASIDFSKSMANIKSAINGSDEDLRKLKTAAMDVGNAFNTGLNPQQQAEAIVELGKAGFTTSQILSGALKGTLMMAAAEGMAVGDAATIAVSSMNQFKLSAADIPKIGDTLASGAAASTASIKSLGDALSMVGAVAGGATNQSLQDTVAVLAAFDNAGVKGSDAGTSLKTMLLRLVPTTKEAKVTMDSLGISFTNSDGSFKKMSEIAGILQTKMAGLTDAQRTVAMQTMFGTDAIRAANILYSLGSTGVEKWTANVSKSGEAARMVKDKLSGAAGMIQKLTAVWDTLKTKFGDKLMDRLIPIFDALGKRIATMAENGQLDKMATNFATGFGAIIDIGGKFIQMLSNIFAWYGSLSAGGQQFVSNLLLWTPAIITAVGGLITLGVKVLEVTQVITAMKAAAVAAKVASVGMATASAGGFAAIGTAAAAALVPIGLVAAAIAAVIALWADYKVIKETGELNKQTRANDIKTNKIYDEINAKRKSRGQKPIDFNRKSSFEQSQANAPQPTVASAGFVGISYRDNQSQFRGSNVSQGGAKPLEIRFGIDKNANLAAYIKDASTANYYQIINDMATTQGA